MSSRLRRAAERLLAFATAIAALGGVPANAQTDPFALPTTTTAKAALAAKTGPGLSEIEVDGEIRPRMVELGGQGEALTIDAADARAAGLPVADNLQGPIRVSSLRLVEWKFNPLTQRLSVSLFRNRDGGNLRDLSTPQWAKASVRNITSFRIGYDITASVQKSTITPAASFDATLARAEMMVTSQFNVQKSGLVRLDSFIQGRIPGTHIFARVGDFVSAGSQAQRPARLVGLQLASSFVDRPDLITTPLPAFSGSVAVPTDVDIITRDQRVEVGKVQPGDYLIRNIPVNVGRGSVDVVLKDAFGRQTVRTVSFYHSATLLAAGLESYAVNAGFVRRNFGLKSSDYGAFAVTGFWRRGLSSFATLETSGEYSPGILNLGSRGDATIGNVALASLELRASRDSAAGSGYLANFSIESFDIRGGAKIGFTLPSPGYRDVASHLGDSKPAKQVFANLSYRIADILPINLSYARQSVRYARPGEPETTRRLEMLSASSSFAPSDRFRMSIQGGVRAAPQRTFFANIGMSMQFGPRHIISASARSEGGSPESNIGYVFEDRDRFGTHVEASITNYRSNISGAATATYSGRHADVQLGAAVSRGSFFGQGSIRGSLIAVGNSTYARSPSSNGLALVRTGTVGDIPVKVENRLIGKTDKGGRLLIDDLSPRVPLRVSIDDTNLPLDALVLTTSRITQVYPNAVGVVEFEARRFRPVVRSVVDQLGMPLDPGTAMIAYPSKIQSLVGYEGTVEINAAGGDRYLEIGQPGRLCRVDLPGAAELENGTTPLTCRSVTIASNDNEVLAGKKVAQRD